MIEKIEHRSALLAVILRSTFTCDGIQFLTPDNFSQQLGYMKRPAGYIIAPHVHNAVRREVHYTKEVLFVRKGRMRVDFYDEDKCYLHSRYLGTGDVILLAYGGHGFEILEDSEIIEVKQGPYMGENDKDRFEPIAAHLIQLK